jgi:hypothetical protein
MVHLTTVPQVHKCTHLWSIHTLYVHICAYIIGTTVPAQVRDRVHQLWKGDEQVPEMLDISAENFKRLSPGVGKRYWLSEDILEAWTNMLSQLLSGAKSTVKVCDGTWYSEKAKRLEIKELQRWLRRKKGNSIDIESSTHVLVPVNAVNHSHWGLVAVDRDRRKVVVYCSLGLGGDADYEMVASVVALALANIWGPDCQWLERTGRSLLSKLRLTFSETAVPFSLPKVLPTITKLTRQPQALADSTHEPARMLSTELSTLLYEASRYEYCAKLAEKTRELVVVLLSTASNYMKEVMGQIYRADCALGGLEVQTSFNQSKSQPYIDRMATHGVYCTEIEIFVMSQECESPVAIFEHPLPNGSFGLRTIIGEKQPNPAMFLLRTNMHKESAAHYVAMIADEDEHTLEAALAKVAVSPAKVYLQYGPEVKAFHLFGVPGDGNCFFEAVGLLDSARQLRLPPGSPSPAPWIRHCSYDHTADPKPGKELKTILSSKTLKQMHRTAFTGDGQGAYNDTPRRATFVVADIWRQCGRPLTDSSVFFDHGCAIGMPMLALADSFGCISVGVESCPNIIKPFFFARRKLHTSGWQGRAAARTLDTQGKELESLEGVTHVYEFHGQKRALSRYDENPDLVKEIEFYAMCLSTKSLLAFSSTKAGPGILERFAETFPAIKAGLKLFRYVETPRLRFVKTTYKMHTWIRVSVNAGLPKPIGPVRELIEAARKQPQVAKLSKMLRLSPSLTSELVVGDSRIYLGVNIDCLITGILLEFGSKVRYSLPNASDLSDGTYVGMSTPVGSLGKSCKMCILDECHGSGCGSVAYVSMESVVAGSAPTSDYNFLELVNTCKSALTAPVRHNEGQPGVKKNNKRLQEEEPIQCTLRSSQRIKHRASAALVAATDENKAQTRRKSTEQQQLKAMQQQSLDKKKQVEQIQKELQAEAAACQQYTDKLKKAKDELTAAKRSAANTKQQHRNVKQNLRRCNKKVILDLAGTESDHSAGNGSYYY